MSALVTTIGMDRLYSLTNMGEQGLQGAGATFPAPLYKTLSGKYSKQTTIQVGFAGIGSGAGLRHIEEGVVDFAATDKPLPTEVLESKGLLQFPVAIGGVVPVFNLKGFDTGDLTISGEVLAQIYLGKITRWSDPALRFLNPSRNLPDEPIIPITRIDGSGTTYLFSDFLCKTHDQWLKKVGKGTSIDWPLGAGAKGSEGVVAFVGRISNSIGFVEYSHAVQGRLSRMNMVDSAERIVSAGSNAFYAAADQADWMQSLRPEMNNQPQPNAWPITGPSFILMNQANFRSRRGAAVREFISWIFSTDDSAVEALGYLPLPKTAKSAVFGHWTQFI